MLSTKLERKPNTIFTKSLQDQGEKILPRSLIFKKKLPPKEKSLGR
jgi:hypothetical protein